MKFLSYITAFLVMAGATCFGQGMRISAYPNTNNLAGTNLFIVAIKGSPGTNMNISWEQLSNLFNTTVGGQYVLEQAGRATNVTILQQTNLGSVLFATVAMPNSGSSGLMLHFATNLLFTNGLSWFEMNTNGSFGIATGGGVEGPGRFDIGPSLDLIVRANQTNWQGLYFTNVAMPYGGSSGILMHNNTNLLLTNGAGWMVIGTNGAVGIGKIADYGNVGKGGLQILAKIQSLMDIDASWSISCGPNYYFWPYGRARLYSPDTNSFELWNSTKGVAGDLRAGVIFSTNGIQSFGTTNQFTGKVGIGTNASAATFHVTGNNAQPVFQAGTTNKPEQLVLSTNGVLSVNPGGGLNQLGCYGFLGMNDTNLIVCAGAAGVYTNVAGTDGFTTITTNGFYGDIAANSAALTNLYAGWYKITICLSGQGENNQALEGEVFTNGVACDLIGFKKTYDAAARMDDMSMTGIIYLPASCRTDFRVQDGGTGGDIIVHRASLTVGTP